MQYFPEPFNPTNQKISHNAAARFKNQLVNKLKTCFVHSNISKLYFYLHLETAHCQMRFFVAGEVQIMLGHAVISSITRQSYQGLHGLLACAFIVILTIFSLEKSPQEPCELRR